MTRKGDSIFNVYADEWAELYKSGLSQQDIASKYGVNRHAVLHILRREGAEPHNKNYKHWADGNRNNWVERYSNGETLDQIAESEDCTGTTIRNELVRRNIKRRETKEYRKHISNEQYFDVLDTEQKCYWLGAIAADGTIERDERRGKVTLTQTASRLNWLERFKTATSALDAKLLYNKWANCYAVSLHSSYMADKLISYGLVPKKSFVLTYPNAVPDQFHAAFIRGYFDGDGWVTSYKRKGRMANIIKWGICGGSKTILARMKDVISDKMGLHPCAVVYKKNSTSGIYYISWQGKSNLLKLYNFLYADATIWMEYKRENMELALGVDREAVQ